MPLTRLRLLPDIEWNPSRPVDRLRSVTIESPDDATLADVVRSALELLDPVGATVLDWNDESQGGPYCLVWWGLSSADRSTVEAYRIPMEVWAVRSNGALYRVDVRFPRAIPIGDVRRAAADGYIDYDVDDLLLSQHTGGYGGGEVISDLIGFLNSIGIDVLSDGLWGAVKFTVRRILRRRSVRRTDADAVVSMAAWERGGIADLGILRSWLELKTTWPLEEVATRLQCSGSAAERLVFALGYERVPGSSEWARSNSSAANRRRARWIKVEQTPRRK